MSQATEDSSDGEMFDFVLGSDDVLEAWNLAITTMKPGERSAFLAHHSLTYGEDGAGEEIPPKATLEFMIHLFPKVAGNDVLASHKFCTRLCEAMSFILVGVRRAWSDGTLINKDTRQEGYMILAAFCPV